MHAAGENPAASFHLRPACSSGRRAEEHQRLRNYAAFLAIRPGSFWISVWGSIWRTRAACSKKRNAFTLAGLEKYALGQTLLESRMAGHELTGRLPFTQGFRGCFPTASPESLPFKSMSREVEDFARQMEPYLRGEELEPLDLELPGIRLYHHRKHPVDLPGAPGALSLRHDQGQGPSEPLDSTPGPESRRESRLPQEEPAHGAS